MGRQLAAYATIALILASLWGCGASSRGLTPSPKAIASPTRAEMRRRVVAQRVIRHELLPTHRAGRFVCLRLPSTGPNAVVVVYRAADVQSLARLLRRKKLNARVELLSSEAMYNGVLRVSQAIEKIRPRRFKNVNVDQEIEHGALICPRAGIQMGVAGEVSSEVRQWARAMVKRFGPDRVEYEYTKVGTATSA